MVSVFLNWGIGIYIMFKCYIWLKSYGILLLKKQCSGCVKSYFKEYFYSISIFRIKKPQTVKNMFYKNYK